MLVSSKLQLAVVTTFIVFISSALGACTKSQTAIVVAVSTDLTIPTEIDHVTIIATREIGTGAPSTPLQETYRLATSEQDRLQGAVDLPATKVILPGSDIETPVVITVHGRIGSTTILTVTKRLKFVAHRALLLRMNLSRRCVAINGMACPSPQTCEQGTCQSIDVDSSLLPNYSDDLVFPPDAGIDVNDASDATDLPFIDLDQTVPDLDQSTEFPIDVTQETDTCVPPITSEICDLKDNNCNGQIDDGISCVWPTTNAQFGYAVAVNGNFAAIGAPLMNMVFVYQWTGASWVFLHTINGFQTGEEFGYSVAINQDRLAIGAPGKSTAYIYILQNVQPPYWSKEWGISTLSGRFGTSVAIQGNNFVVGEPAHSNNYGRVTVFPYENGWNSQGTNLQRSDAAQGDLFGSSVAISGDLVVVGAPMSGSGSGKVYVYSISSNFANTYQLTRPSAVDDSAQFGASVAIHNTRVVVGAPNYNSGAGAAYVFDGVVPAATVPTSISTTVIPLQSSQGMGTSVAVSAAGVAVGATGDSVNKGEVYFFHYLVQPNSPTSKQQLRVSDWAALPLGAKIGASVAMDSSMILFGVPFDDAWGQNSGSAYFFNLSKTGAGCTQRIENSYCWLEEYKFPLYK